MKITKEVRDFMKHYIGSDSNVEAAATYVHNEFCNQHWPEMEKIRVSNLFKDLLAAFEWFDDRWGVHPTDSASEKFIDMLIEMGWKTHIGRLR